MVGGHVYRAEYLRYDGRYCFMLSREHPGGFSAAHPCYSILLQHYPEGTDLRRHRDLDGHNRIVWVLLKAARAGGETKVYGDHKSYLGGRVMSFDGGTTDHEVTKVAKGSRTSLIFQCGWYAERKAGTKAGSAAA